MVFFFLHKKETPTLSSSNLHIFLACFRTTPWLHFCASALLLLYLFCAERMGTNPCQLWIIQCTTTKSWGSGWPSVVPSLLDTSSVHTRAHTVIVFVHAVCPAIFSLFLWTVVCVYVCPRSKPHVLDGKGGRVSSKTPVSLYSGSLTSSSNGFGFDFLVFGTDTKTTSNLHSHLSEREREKDPWPMDGENDDPGIDPMLDHGFCFKTCGILPMGLIGFTTRLSTKSDRRNFWGWCKKGVLREPVMVVPSSSSSSSTSCRVSTHYLLL